MILGSPPGVRSEQHRLCEHLTKILGNHGRLARPSPGRDALLQEQTFSPRGLYTFNDGQTALNTGSGATVTSFGNNFASFLLDVPGQAGRDLATFFPNYRATQSFAFVHDKWLVTPKLSADIGVRWEFYTPATPAATGGFSNYNPTNNTLVVSGIGGNPNDLGIATHYKYFAPRLGLAYRLTESTVFRAGFGISYTPFPDNSYAYNFPVRANNQFDPAVTTFGPAVLPSGQPATFANGFPALIQPTIPSNGIITNPTVASAYFVVNQSFKNPYVESWNAVIQHSLPWRFVLDLAYVGSHSVDTVVNYNLNAATVVGQGKNGQPEFPTFGRTANTNLLFAGYSSSYNALQVKFDRKFSGGLKPRRLTFGKGMGFQQGDDGGLTFTSINAGITPERLRSHANFRTEYRLRSPVWQRQALGFFGSWRRDSRWLAHFQLYDDYVRPSAFLYRQRHLTQAPGNTQTPNLVAPVQILHGVGTKVHSSLRRVSRLRWAYIRQCGAELS